MQTVSPLETPWGAVPNEPGLYAPTRPNGRRTPGWEDVNVTALAEDLGVSVRYLLAVLSGQRNCTLALLQRTAQALGIALTELITRMETAYQLRLLAVASTPSKSTKRRLRSERRAMSTQ